MTSANNDYEIFKVPKDVWNIIVEYLDASHMYKQLSHKEQCLKDEIQNIEQTFLLTIGNLNCICNKLKRIARKFDNGISFLDYTKQHKQLTRGMDKYSIEFHEQIQSLHFTLQNIHNSLHKLKKSEIYFDTEKTQTL